MIKMEHKTLRKRKIKTDLMPTWVLINYLVVGSKEVNKIFKLLLKKFTKLIKSQREN